VSQVSAQAELLSYYGQQLIAHAATLFAVLTAAFTFMAHMHPQGVGRKRLRQGLFIFISGVLLSIAFYALFRILYYGAAVTQVVSISDGDSLGNYSITVSDAVKTTPLGHLLAFLGFHSLFAWWGLVISLLLGLIAASAVYFVTYKN